MCFVELRQCDEDRVLQSQPFAVGCVNSFALRIESAKTLDLIELRPAPPLPGGLRTVGSIPWVEQSHRFRLESSR